MPDTLAPADTPTETGAPPAPDGIAPALWDQLHALGADEQQVLAEFIDRGARDRCRLGPLDEISLVTNALKSRDDDDVSVMVKIEEKVGPSVRLTYPDAPRVPLETDLLDADAGFADVLLARRSRRGYAGTPLSLQELSTLLVLGYGAGIPTRAYNRPDVPLRAVPSAGGLQCVELYVVVNSVEGLEPGIYHYDAVGGALELVERGSFRYRLTDVFYQAEWITDASVVLMTAPVLPRLSWKYNRRALRMVHIDSGIVTQTLHLAATSLKLRSCVVLGFDDETADDFLGLDGRTQSTTLALAVGRHPWENGPDDRTSGGDGATGEWSFGMTS